MKDLSIIVPTFNRAPLLARCLEAIHQRTLCNYEVIVVDGASTDATPRVLSAAERSMGGRLTIITEPKREGFVRAANKGFDAATGRCVTWINDDARPLPGSLDNAMNQILRAPANVGLVAMFHHYEGVRNIAFEQTHEDRAYHLLHVRGTLYANFGVGRLETFRDLGFFDERFFLNGADPDLSLKAWHAGLSVVPAHCSFIEHDEHDDARRAQDSTRAQEDNARLFAKWNLPPRSEKNEFDPKKPCTLQGLHLAKAA
jgi:GT2 family glycosyltransferase